MDYNEFIRYMNTAYNYNTHNGMRVTELSEGWCVCEVDLAQPGMNAMNVAHGGLLFGLCDEATGLASAATGRGMLTLSANMHFLRPGRAGVLRAEARCIKSGRTTGLYEAKVMNEEGTLLAQGEFTIFFTGDEIDLDARWREENERAESRQKQSCDN